MTGQCKGNKSPPDQTIYYDNTLKKYKIKQNIETEMETENYFIPLNSP
jgi:hypothetical protein